MPGLVANVRYNLAVAARHSFPLSAKALFTKGEVNRAGVLLLDRREQTQRDDTERTFGDSDEKQFDEAHLIVRRKNYLIEVQLRTIGQDIWANMVEETGRRFGVDFKFGVGATRNLAFFADMAELIARFDRGEILPDDLKATLKELPSSTTKTARKEDPHEPD